MSSSSIPLYPITTSQWSFDSEDYQRLVEQHNQPERVVELRSPAQTYPPTTVHLRLRRVRQRDRIALEEDSKWSKWIKDLFGSIWCCLPD
jgi:hypothetical protein